MNLVFAILMLGVVTGCPNKESLKSESNRYGLVGIYHTEFKQDGDSYEPETLYIFNADGTLLVEYYYEKNGKASVYKEVSLGKYKVEGDQLKVFDFKPYITIVQEKIAFLNHLQPALKKKPQEFDFLPLMEKINFLNWQIKRSFKSLLV